MAESVVCIRCKNSFQMKDVISVGVIGMGFVYCKDCLVDALEALKPLIHFFLLPASGNWHCETCVWADLDEGNLY